MRNFNEGINSLINVGLDGLTEANKLYVWLCDLAESDLGPTDVLASATHTSGTTVLNVTGLTCSARTVDLGGPFSFPEVVGSPKSVAISTKAPTTGGSLLVAVQDINAGAVLNLATNGPVSVDALSILFAYQGEV